MQDIIQKLRELGQILRDKRKQIKCFALLCILILLSSMGDPNKEMYTKELPPENREKIYRERIYRESNEILNTWEKFKRENKNIPGELELSSHRCAVELAKTNDYDKLNKAITLFGHLTKLNKKKYQHDYYYALAYVHKAEIIYRRRIYDRKDYHLVSEYCQKAKQINEEALKEMRCKEMFRE